MKVTIPVVAYLRMSNKKQDKSIPAQRAEIERYALAHGYTIIRWYSDDGISGDESDKRHGFQNLIRDAQALGDFTAIIVWDQDRFSRFDPLEANHYWFLLRQAGVKIVTVSTGELDFSTLGSWLTASVAQHGKNEYLRDLSRNVVRGHLASAKAGRWQGGPAPFGYQVQDGDLVPDLAAAPIVRRIFTDYANNGVSLRQLAERLNNEGIPSPGGKKWRFMQLRKTLMHDVYIGTYTYGKNPDGKYHHSSDGEIVAGPNKQRQPGYRTSKGCITIPDHHEPLVSPEMFAKVRQAFTERKRDTTPYKSTRTPYTLAGVCRCGHCGNTLIGMVKNYRTWQNRIYVCSGYNQGGAAVCSRNYVHEEEMLACIVAKVEEKALAPGNLERLQAAMLRRLTAKQAKPVDDQKQLRGRLAKLDKEISQGADRLLKLPEDLHDVLVERLRAWRGERDALRNRLDAHQPQERVNTRDAEGLINAAIAKLAGLRDQLHVTDPGKLRLTLRKVVDRVELFFDSMPYGTRTKSELSRGTIYLREDNFADLYPGGSTLGKSQVHSNKPSSEAG